MNKILIAFILIQCISLSRSNRQIQTVSTFNWEDQYATNDINKNCYYNASTMTCDGMCFNGKPCRILLNFDEPVCGCFYCRFNRTTSKCYGQCSNILLQTCVSKVYHPTKSSDCICASCSPTWEIIMTTLPYYYGEVDYIKGEKYPSCNPSTCFPGNSCLPVYVSKNHVAINNTLYCQCNNDN